MNVLNHRFAQKRRLLAYLTLALLAGAFTMLWIGQRDAQASEAPTAVYQPGTLPPRTPTPVSQPPTPTPRPRDDDNQTQPPTPTPTTAAAGGQPATPLPAPGALTGVINATTLNVRQGPGATFAVIGRLTNGATVTVLARNADNSWLKICCLPDGQTAGWVSAQFVTPNYTPEQLAALPIGEGATPPVAAPTAVATSPAASGALTGTVAVVALNVREAPSTTDPILGKLSSGTIVTLLGRNAAGDWWLVCCAPNGAGNGWASAQFIDTDAPAAALAALPVTTGRETPIVATPAPSPTPVTAATTPTTTVTVSTTLAMTALQQPASAVQGEQVVLAFTITNTGEAAAVNAELSFEVPAGLAFTGVSASDGGEAVEEEVATGGALIIVTWPELAPGLVTTAKVTVTVADDLANGAVVDGAAVSLADNADASFAPISVGMPPAAPPDFQ
jgi:uncharacterized repeat protein (TIGR01451 family)